MAFSDNPRETSSAVTTPEGIGFVQLLSIRGMCKLHLLGVKKPGLVKALNRLGFQGKTVSSILPQIEREIETLKSRKAASNV